MSAILSLTANLLLSSPDIFDVFGRFVYVRIIFYAKWVKRSFCKDNISLAGKQFYNFCGAGNH